jgi:hypothetical protein
VPGARTPRAAALADAARGARSEPHVVAVELSPEERDAIVGVVVGSQLLHIACMRVGADWFAHGSADGPGQSWHSTVTPRRMRGLAALGPNVGASVLSAPAPDGVGAARLESDGEERLIQAAGGWVIGVEWNVPDHARNRLRFLGWISEST